MKKLDLTKLLEIGNKVYSTMYGEMTVCDIDYDDSLKINVENDSDSTWYNKDGTWDSKGECILFPSVDERTWEYYEPNIPDKSLVWCWDDERSFRRSLEFYDAVNKKTFWSANGHRNGSFYHHYELYKGEEPEWAIERRKELED